MIDKLAKEEDGFTLPELLVTMMMMIMVMFALYNIFDMSIRVFSFGNDKTEATANARMGLEKMEREIRAAYPVNKAANKNYIFFSANGSATNPPLSMPVTPGQLTIGNDLDGDKKISCPNTQGNCEYITYRLNAVGDTLLRNNTVNGSDTSTGGDPVVQYVKSLSFQYLKSDGTNAGTEDVIAVVRITLEVEVKRGPRAGTQTLTTDVALRNRGN